MNEILFYFLIFIVGLFFGSFINLVSDRLLAGKSIFIGRSHCNFCQTKLSIKDLVPVFSFLALKGKCRYCKEKLSFYYPLSELLTALVFMGTAFFVNLYSNFTNYYFLLIFVYFLVIALVYIALTLTDLKFYLLPDKLVLFGILFVLAFTFFNFTFSAIYSYKAMSADEFGKYLIESGYWKSQMLVIARSLVYTFISTFGITTFFFFLSKIKNGAAMGFGDVKLSILIGLFNGFPFNLIAIMLAFVFGALISVLLILFKVKTTKDTIPFGPFMILGSAVSLVFGPLILNWYLGFLQ